jgi:8-amino-7-oxononanoate synthase
LIDVLVQRARTYLYTTALPPALACAARTALEIVQTEPWRRAHLADLIRHFRGRATALDLPLRPSATPIQPIVLGSERRALAASAHLFEAGFLVPAIRPPTVPAGASRLRITLSAAHTFADLDRLLDALADWLSLQNRTSR